MHLLSKVNNSDKVEIYTVLPKQKIKEYKKSYIEKIPYYERVLVASTNDETPLEELEEKIYKTTLNRNASGIWGGNSYHSIDKYTDVHSNISEIDYDERYKQVIECYINGGFTNASVKRINDYAVEKGFIDKQYMLITDRYRRFDLYDVKYMHNIIQITKELFLLQKLEQGQFHELVDEDLQEQLDMFNIDLVKETNLELIRYLDMIGIIPGTYSNILSQAEVGQKILKIKKR